MRTLIKGGTIVNADAMTRADVLIEGEEIVLIGLDLHVEADEVIDAAGKWVIPGGIDGHTHMELPFGGTFAKDSQPRRRLLSADLIDHKALRFDREPEGFSMLMRIGVASREFRPRY